MPTILWRHTNGKISLWTVNNQGDHLNDIQHGPFEGFTALNYADGKLLWGHTNGKISLWTVDNQGNHVSDIQHGPFIGFTALNYDNFPSPAVGPLSNFTFAADISAANRNKLLDRHRVALASIGVCNNLSELEKGSLHQAYRRPIHHTTLNRPGANASATVGGSTLNINFGVLFPQGDEEISQTLIHEMMHCAGFSHPVRRDPPAGQSCAAPNPSVFDCPNDNGQYYGTAPLRAEFCIAGDQSDARLRLERKVINESCIIDEQGVATIHTR